MIRILLADDESLIRSGLAALLSTEDDFEVVTQVSSGDEVLTSATLSRPDVAVLDLQMPGLDGIEVAALLHQELPACASIIVTSHGLPGHLKRALAAGAKGFLPKTVTASVLAQAVRIAHSGGRYIDPDLAAEAISAAENPLTPRETEVLRYAVGGTPVGVIARRASLSPGTVRNYLSNATAKLNVANRHEAVEVARIAGWI